MCQIMDCNEAGGLIHIFGAKVSLSQCNVEQRQICRAIVRGLFLYSFRRECLFNQQTNISHHNNSISTPNASTARHVCGPSTQAHGCLETRRCSWMGRTTGRNARGNGRSPIPARDESIASTSHSVRTALPYVPSSVESADGASSTRSIQHPRVNHCLQLHVRSIQMAVPGFDRVVSHRYW